MVVILLSHSLGKEKKNNTRRRKSIGGLEEENANELRRKSSQIKRAYRPLRGLTLIIKILKLLDFRLSSLALSSSSPPINFLLLWFPLVSPSLCSHIKHEQLCYDMSMHQVHQWTFFFSGITSPPLCSHITASMAGSLPR